MIHSIKKYAALFWCFMYLSVTLTYGDEDPSWGGCNPSGGETLLVSRTKETLVCISVGPSDDWASGIQYLRYSFQPKGDEYSRITLPGSYKNLMSDTSYSFLRNSNVTVFTSSQNSISFLRTLYDRANGHVYPHLTAIIDVDNGVVKGILWDDACIFCSNDKCLENTLYFNGTEAHLNEPTRGCYKTREECDKNDRSGGSICDLTIYVTWTGTDKDGKPMLSSNKRYSLFNPKQVQDSFKDSLPDFSNIKLPWD